MMKLIVFLLLIVSVYSLTEIIIILGCSNNHIQEQRVKAGLEYIKRSKLSKVLFLSGGIKNNIHNSVSEASKMLNQIKNENLNIEIIIDEKSKNTAENFVNLKNWIKNNNVCNLFSYVIVTSDFHKKRALKLFNGIFNNIKVKFITSKSNCSHCWKDEKTHLKNVKSDIMNALIFIN